MEADILNFNFVVILRLLVLFMAPLIFLLYKTRKDPELAKKIDKFGGPRSFPVIGCTYRFVGVDSVGLFNKFNYDDSKAFGRLYRVWLLNRPKMIISSAKNAELILQGMQHHHKSPNYEFLHSWMGLGLLTSSDEKWRAHRKTLTPAFHFNILQEFLHIFNKNVNILNGRLKKLANNGKDFNIFDQTSLCALDIICESSMGAHVNAQQQDDSPYVKAVRDLNDFLVDRYFSPILRGDWIYSLSSLKRKTDVRLKTVNSFTEKVIGQRREYLRNAKTPEKIKSEDDDVGEKRKNLAFLDLLLTAQAEGAPFMSDKDIRDEVSTFMFEGHDTVTTAICWTLFMMGTHPEIQQKVWQELDQVFGASERAPTMNDLAELKYLERCIKETMRLYPSVPFFERYIREDAVLDCGRILPAGCTVTFNVFVLHRDPEHFPDPEKFDPDRFLLENIQGRHPYAYLPFSAGPRNCIGQKFAILEEKVLVSSILRKFRVEAAHKPEDALLEMGMVLRPKNGLRIKLYER